MNQHNPDTVSPPYETILELAGLCGFDEQELARLLGVSINRDTVITPELAQKLQSIFSVFVSFWINRQHNYDQWKARHDTTR